MNTSPYDNLPMGKKEDNVSNTGYTEVNLETMAVSGEAYEPEKSIATIESLEPAEHEEPAETYEPAEPLPSQNPASVQELMTKKYEPYIPTKRDSLPPAYCDRLDITRTSPLTKSPQYSKSTIKNRCSTSEFILPFEDSLLVPDTMSDMTEIFFTEASASITRNGKTTYKVGDMLSGEIIFYTVYRPDIRSSSSVDVVKSTIPFKTDKCWGENENASFKVSLSVKSSKADMINERKFTARGEVSILLTEIISRELNIFKSMDDSDFMLQEGTVDITELSFETEETAEISQEMKIAEGSPAPAKILKEDIKISETHKQITSGKLVINAVISTQILYIGREDGENKLCSISSKTDFTQFVVLKNDSNTALIKTEFLGDGLKTSIENDSIFMLEGKVRIFIQGYKNRETKIISDAYHKEKDLKFDIVRQPVCSIKETVSGEISAREVISIDDTKPKPEKLLCANLQSTSLSGRLENSRIIIEGTLPVKILALDENDSPFIIESTIPLRGSLDSSSAGANNTLDIRSSIKDVWIDNINSRQVEINVSISVEVWVNSGQEFTTLENLCFAERKHPEKRVSMALYVVSSGDTLWDIAKKYKSDINALAKFNQLNPCDPLPEGMKLFITK